MKRTSRGLTAALLFAASAYGQRPPQGEAPVLSAAEELAKFTVAEGFECELVVSDPDVQKIVDIAFDDAGRMWAITAVEYPIDGNESEGVAELYEQGGRDQVLVFDEPWKEGPHKGRVFADGLFIPMAILPTKGGALVGEGPNILFMPDEDGDGRADREEVVLTGFGIQDSHLLPHRFVRGPGDWVYLAQGAFNSSRVVTTSGDEVQFDKCKVGRFQADGSAFEVVGIGLNNIWGFVLDRRGNKWIQEANDHGYPVVPFEHGMSYPGIGGHRFHDYSPWRPSLAEFRMGGTGMSGQARSDHRSGFPAPWDETHFIANPIINKIQSIRTHRNPEDASDVTLEQAPDLLVSEDMNFRPIAIHFGPDGCLYIVDWYNPIISHNEVPRDHPARDKTSSRIWRVRHESQEREKPVDVALAKDSELVDLLRSDSTLTARAAWNQIRERELHKLRAPVTKLALDTSAPVEDRVLAAWVMVDMGWTKTTEVRAFLRDPQPEMRREGARHIGRVAADAAMIDLISEDPDTRVRQAAIESLGHKEVFTAQDAVSLLKVLREAIEGPTTRLQQNGQHVHVGLAGDIDFERSRVRSVLAAHPDVSLALHDDRGLPASVQAFLALSAGGSGGAERVARALPRLGRTPNGEELSLLAQHIDNDAVREAIAGLLVEPGVRRHAARMLIDSAGRWDSKSLEAGLGETVRAIVAEDPSREHCELLLRCATELRLAALEEDVLAILDEGRADRLVCVRALVELGSDDAPRFYALANSSLPGTEGRRLAAAALARISTDEAFDLLLELWLSLERPAQRDAIAALITRPEGAERLIGALEAEDIELDVLDAATLSRLELHLGEDPRLADLRGRVAGAALPVLRFDGAKEDFVDTDLTLDSPFTIECWVQLDEGIGNQDGLLGLPPEFDLNFYDGRVRLYLGADRGDVIIATRKTEAGRWTHIALTRDGANDLALYIDGELDLAVAGAGEGSWEGLDVARTGPDGGTEGFLAELRIWNRARTAAEIGADFRRRFTDEERHEGLLLRLPGDDSRLSGNARVEEVLDQPPLQTGAEVEAELARFARYRALASEGGDTDAGRSLFAQHCGACHTVGGEGGQIGPVLDGAGTKGVEGLLRAVLTPSAGVESGYRTLIVRRKGGEILDGFLASEDADSITLRRKDREDLILPRSEIEEARFDRLSVMPDGLLDTLSDEDVQHLFAYLRSLR